MFSAMGKSLYPGQRLSRSQKKQALLLQYLSVHEGNTKKNVDGDEWIGKHQRIAKNVRTNLTWLWQLGESLQRL